MGGAKVSMMMSQNNLMSCRVDVDDMDEFYEAINDENKLREQLINVAHQNTETFYSAQLDSETDQKYEAS